MRVGSAPTTTASNIVQAHCCPSNAARNIEYRAPTPLPKPACAPSVARFASACGGAADISVGPSDFRNVGSGHARLRPMFGAPAACVRSMALPPRTTIACWTRRAVSARSAAEPSRPGAVWPSTMITLRVWCANCSAPRATFLSDPWARMWTVSGRRSPISRRTRSPVDPLAFGEAGGCSSFHDGGSDMRDGIDSMNT